MKRQELEQLQAKRLREVVRHAYRNVPFYGRLYQQYGFHPDDLRSLEDAKKIPTLGKELVRATSLEERTATNVDVSKSMIKRTSGSTGIPIRILEDDRSAAYLEALHIRRFLSIGVRPWHKIARFIIPEQGHHSYIEEKRGVWGWIRRKRISRIPIVDDVESVIPRLSKFNPDVLVATPSYLRVLAIKFETSPFSTRPRIIVSMGEVLDPSTRNLVEESFRAKIFDGYGCIEIAPLEIAWQCSERSGYHINTDSVVVELLGGENAREPGVVCATSLFRRATPMIRYIVGDVATPRSDDCRCGRRLPLLEKIEGRTVDFLVRSDGSLVSPYRAMSAIDGIPGIAKYKITQESDYSIEILVEPLNATVQTFEADIRRRFQTIFGDLTINVRLTRLSHTGGKFKLVESRAAQKSL